MPIYNYECKKCGRKYESLQKMDTKTIKCGCGEDTEKVPSLTNFQLRGGGWAKDGYSNGGSSKT